MARWLNKDGYPTAAAERRIRQWDGMDADNCLDFVASLWKWPDWGVSRTLKPEEALLVHAEEGDHYLRFATGGWSGNEDLLVALDANLLVTMFTWRLSAAGGLHIYQYMRGRLTQDGE